jgi:hypothetical protein
MLSEGREMTSLVTSKNALCSTETNTRNKPTTRVREYLADGAALIGSGRIDTVRVPGTAHRFVHIAVCSLRTAQRPPAATRLGVGNDNIRAQLDAERVVDGRVVRFKGGGVAVDDGCCCTIVPSRAVFETKKALRQPAKAESTAPKD